MRNEKLGIAVALLIFNYYKFLASKSISRYIKNNKGLMLLHYLLYFILPISTANLSHDATRAVAFCHRPHILNLNFSFLI